MLDVFTNKISKKPIKVIGCGLAGAEIAFILANNGFDVHIFDDGKNHPTKSFDYYDKYQNFMTENMIFELDCLNSPLLSLAQKYGFSKFGFEYDESFMCKVREELERNPRIKLFHANIEQINVTENNVIATGHNTSEKIIDDLENYIGKMHVCYYQPEKIVVEAKSVNFDKLNFINETECYANLTEDEYRIFENKIRDFNQRYEQPGIISKEKQITVEGLARMGTLALRNTVLRPHFDEKNRPYASLKMTYQPYFEVFIVDDFYSALDDVEQEELLKMFDALSKCQILRFCKVKRKTHLLAPMCLNERMQVDENIYVCGGFAGTAGSFESLLMSNYCAYCLLDKLKSKACAEILREKTCIGKILENLIKKSVIKFRLFLLKYDIIKNEDLNRFRIDVENQKICSQNQIQKFKEKFYGKYF